LRRFSDAPLALLTGTPAKRVKEIGAPSLKHPFARVFPDCAHFAAGELKVGVVRVFPLATETLAEIGKIIMGGDCHQLRSALAVIDWLSLYQSFSCYIVIDRKASYPSCAGIGNFPTGLISASTRTASVRRKSSS
jgi:hypothetical protein